MQMIGLLIFLAFGTSAFGQAVPKTAKSPAEFVPSGYVVVQKLQGDLNGDKQADSVLIIKATDKTNFVKREDRGELDRNRRGVIIALQTNDGFELALENRNCFSSENEDGGVYFAPELGVFIEKGNLRVHYFGGRYGFWAYKFRYEKSDFELIGYDSSQNHGPLVEKMISINFVTKKMLIKENIDRNGAESLHQKFKETWKRFTLSKPIKLRDISDFDGFEVLNMLGSVQ